jgi:NAD+ kinase
MKIVLVGKNLEDIRPLLGTFGFIEDSDSPELVIAHGGDGALLGAAHAYAHLPLLPIRDARTAPLCPRHECSLRMKSFCAKKTSLVRVPKVCGQVRDITMHALNDVFLHNCDRSSALRYRVKIDQKLYAYEVVGDAVGISSVHGSTAYYKSITHSLFRVGIGLAFSNSTEEVNHLVLDVSSVVEIEVVRGPGILIADNVPERPLVSEGEIVTFRQSGEYADIYGLEEFMCPDCRVLRHAKLHSRPTGWPF